MMGFLPFPTIDIKSRRYLPYGSKGCQVNFYKFIIQAFSVKSSSRKPDFNGSRMPVQVLHFR